MTLRPLPSSGPPGIGRVQRNCYTPKNTQLTLSFYGLVVCLGTHRKVPVRGCLITGDFSPALVSEEHGLPDVTQTYRLAIVPLSSPSLPSLSKERSPNSNYLTVVTLFPPKVSSPASDYQLRKVPKQLNYQGSGQARVHGFSALKYHRALPPLFSPPNKINNPSISSNHHPLLPHQKSKEADQCVDWVTEFPWSPLPPH